MYEIRYRGGLVSEHATRDEALGQADAHHADIQDPEALLINPARPVRLYCRGALVETFLSSADAGDYIAANANESTPADSPAWWIGTEAPEHPHQIWPEETRELDVSDAATVWAEGQRPLPVNKPVA